MNKGLEATGRTTNAFSFWSVLGIVFIVLKLTDTIAWSWWWVLAPFWAPWAAALVLGLIIGLSVVTYRALK
jgi:hypothetical protein